MTPWFKWCSYFQHGKHLCPDVGERAWVYVTAMVSLLLKQKAWHYNLCFCHIFKELLPPALLTITTSCDQQLKSEVASPRNVHSIDRAPYPAPHHVSWRSQRRATLNERSLPKSQGPCRECGTTYIFFFDWLSSCLLISSASTGGLLPWTKQSCDLTN